MSKVISFRLDADNPREARAIDVLHAWTAIGRSVRYILTEALLELDYPEHLLGENASLGELTKTLDQINKLLEHISFSDALPRNKSTEETTERALTNVFIEAVKDIAKTGLHNT